MNAGQVQHVTQFFVAAPAVLANGLPDAIIERTRGEHIDALSIVSPATAADGRQGALVVLVTTGSAS